MSITEKYRIELDRSDDDEEIYVILQNEGGEWTQYSDSNSLEGAAALLESEFLLAKDDVTTVVLDFVGRSKEEGDAPSTTAIAKAMMPKLSDEEEERLAKEREENLKALREEAEKIEELNIKTVADAARLIRAGALMIAEAGEKVILSGHMGSLSKPMQTFLQNMMEVEKDYQAVLAGTPRAAGEEEEVPELLADFLKRSELEKAERKAREEEEREKEREEARKKAAAAAAAVHHDDDDYDETKGEGDGLTEEQRAAREEEKKKIDDFFNADIF